MTRRIFVFGTGLSSLLALLLSPLSKRTRAAGFLAEHPAYFVVDGCGNSRHSDLTRQIRVKDTDVFYRYCGQGDHWDEKWYWVKLDELAKLFGRPELRSCQHREHWSDYREVLFRHGISYDYCPYCLAGGKLEERIKLIVALVEQITIPDQATGAAAVTVAA